MKYKMVEEKKLERNLGRLRRACDNCNSDFEHLIYLGYHMGVKQKQMLAREIMKRGL